MASRQQSLIIPREHGAWGILLVPLVTGAITGLLAGGNPGSLAPLSIAALALFWLRTPLESWIGSTPIRAHGPAEIRLVRNTAFVLAAVAIGAVVWLFWGGRNRSLLWIGAAAAVAFLAQAVLRRIRRSARTAAQMIGAAGLTSTAPAAYCVVTGTWTEIAWSLWAANFLFAVNQIHFVQIRIHAARAKTKAEKLGAGGGFLAGQLALVALLASACALRWYPWLGAVAFLPILFRGFAWYVRKPQPLVIHALGKSELAYACTFGLLLILGMRLA